MFLLNFYTKKPLYHTDLQYQRLCGWFLHRVEGDKNAKRRSYIRWRCINEILCSGEVFTIKRTCKSAEYMLNYYSAWWHSYGGLTEWLRSLIGNQVRCNSPVGSSPMSSAKWKKMAFSRLFLFFAKKELCRDSNPRGRWHTIEAML